MQHISILTRAFEKAQHSYKQQAVVQAHMANKLAALIPENTHFDACIELGTGTGLLTHQLLTRLNINTLLINDLSANILNTTRQMLTQQLHTNTSIVTQPGDMQKLPMHIFKEAQLIASAAAIQWLENPLLFIKQLTAHMQNGASLLISAFGPLNLSEIRSITMRGLHYPTLQQYTQLLNEQGLNVIHASQECKTIYFPSPRQAMLHLKATGVTHLPDDASQSSNSQQASLSLAQIESKYHQRYNCHRGIPVTYQPIYLYATKNLPTFAAELTY